MNLRAEVLWPPFLLYIISLPPSSCTVSPVTPKKKEEKNQGSWILHQVEIHFLMPFSSPLLGRRNMNLRFKQKKNSFSSSMPLLPTSTSTHNKINLNTSISNQTSGKNGSNFLSTNTESKNTRARSCRNIPSTSRNSLSNSSRDLLSTNTSELDSWDLSRSLESTCSEAKSHEAIQRGVSRLVLLADRCERLNSSLENVVTQSHKILDNSFLSQQVNYLNILHSFM